tara:strand:- start:85 stop:570 length:486 start_codon:yes stop_codon:yes gene_type:complete
MNPNEGLENLLKQFSDQIKSSPENPKAILALFRNWIIPILTDFGVAINQTAFGLGQVAESVGSTQELLDRTLNGEQLMACADLSMAMKLASEKNDYDAVNEGIAALLNVLEEWLPEVDAKSDEPEVVQVEAPVEPEPEPKPVKKPTAKKTTRRKVATKEAS